MFKTRLLSGIVLVVLALVLIITGGDLLLGSLLLISLIGMFELYRFFEIEKSIAAIVGYLAAVLFYGNLWTGFLSDSTALVMGTLILLMSVYVVTYPRFRTEQVMAVFFGVFYVSAMLSCIYQTRMLERGAYLVWLIFLCSWGCDTCAYCAGMMFGKHKLVPVLSPKKTIEGAVGGVAGAALLGYLFACVVPLILTSIIIYRVAAESMEETSMEFASAFSSQIVTLMDDLIDTYDRLTKSVLVDNDVITSLSEQESVGAIDRMNSQLGVRKIMMRLMTLKPEIKTACILTEDGQFYQFSSEGDNIDSAVLAEQPWVAEIRESSVVLPAPDFPIMAYIFPA